MLNETQTAFDLKGKTALITGGGTGLGAGMAACFVRAGAKVILVGRREEPLRQTAEALGGSSVWFTADLQNEVSIASLVAGVLDAHGGVDILVSNAGVHLKKDAVNTSMDELETVLRTHVTGAHALISGLAPSMQERGEGSILLICSMTALMGMPRVIAYTAAKSALLGMVRAYSSEFAPLGVRVNGIAPGWIESPMLRQALSGDPAREQRILQRTHLARFGDPDDIGHAAVYLSSPAAKFITGITLPVDGGASSGF
ncbi:MAG: SDR family oxidoreductase [Verrucomicrobia bacterium]|nr:SDR family oxidoreductase [Verrucomicrobiota bacterium]MCH8511175.1 SDR family oxidoreductase [Kiritimatiellia bacterium]